jgi:hypothetical protein
LLLSLLVLEQHPVPERRHAGLKEPELLHQQLGRRDLSRQVPHVLV